MDAREYREEILKLLIVHAGDAYKEAIRVGSVIEDKAQKVAALSGIFLAAGFGFIKKENLENGSATGGSITLLALLLAIVGLIVAVVLCLRVLWVRAQASSVKLSVMRRLADDTLRGPDDDLTDELQDAFRVEVTNLWAAILETQDRINSSKANLLRTAQLILTLSIGLVSASLLLVLAKVLASRIWESVVQYFSR